MEITMEITPKHSGATVKIRSASQVPWPNRKKVNRRANAVPWPAPATGRDLPTAVPARKGERGGWFLHACMSDGRTASHTARAS